MIVKRSMLLVFVILFFALTGQTSSSYAAAIKHQHTNEQNFSTQNVTSNPVVFILSQAYDHSLRIEESSGNISSPAKHNKKNSFCCTSESVYTTANKTRFLFLCSGLSKRPALSLFLLHRQFLI